MAYAIMRAKKKKGMGLVATALRHAYRERPVPNADLTKTPTNEALVSGSADEAMGRLRARLPEKRRVNSVLAVEYVCTASPEWWREADPEKQREFFQRSITWLSEKYGRDNIISAVVHNDEATPHLSAFVVPRTPDGRLSAKEFIGNRDKMRLDQTNFAVAVHDLGLERGIEKSVAKHQAVRTFYTQLEAKRLELPSITPAQLEPKKLPARSQLKSLFVPRRETTEEVAARLNAELQERLKPVASRAETSILTERRVRELQRTLNTQRTHLNAYEQFFAGLDREHILALAREAARMRVEQQQRQQQRQKAQAKERKREPQQGQGLDLDR